MKTYQLTEEQMQVVIDALDTIRHSGFVTHQGERPHVASLKPLALLRSIPAIDDGVSEEERQDALDDIEDNDCYLYTKTLETLYKILKKEKKHE